MSWQFGFDFFSEREPKVRAALPVGGGELHGPRRRVPTGALPLCREVALRTQGHPQPTFGVAAM